MVNPILDVLAGYGLDPVRIGVALLAIVLFCTMFKAPTGPSLKVPEIELHPDHVAYIKEKEAEHCSGNFGKGLRCIIDFLREEEDESVAKILAEKPKYTDGFETYDIDIHPQQFEFLEGKGIKISDVEGEEYKDLSKASRAIFDWAMRKQKEGDSQDYDLFEIVRCLNC